MNILYVGPYRQNNSDGYLSLNLLLDCYEYHTKIVSRPIFNSNNFIKLENIEKLLSKIENNHITHFDVIIQHLDIDSFVYTSKISKYIFIPILDNKKISFIQKQKLLFLENKGLIISCDQISSYILETESIKHQQIDTNINSRLLLNSTGSFNFGLYNRYKKYYSIINSDNENDIKKLIINFIQYHKNDTKCLILFMTNVSQAILDKYNSYIKNIYKTLKINYSINKIIIAPVELNHEILCAIHNSGDIFLDMQQNILTTYAECYKKNIYYSNNDFYYSYDINNLNEHPTVEYNKNFDWSQNINTKSNKTYPLSKILTNHV